MAKICYVPKKFDKTWLIVIRQANQILEAVETARDCREGSQEKEFEEASLIQERKTW